MPRYYFDVGDGSLEIDEDGISLDGLEQARSQSIMLVGEMLRFNAQPIWDGHGLRVEVSDQQRKPLFIVSVSTNSLFPET